MNVLNAYVMAPNKEMIWKMLGPEFGDKVVKSAITIRALYGLKSTGAPFREHHAQCMQDLWYDSCKTEVDMWWKPEIRLQDKFEFYSYNLCYVDEFFVPIMIQIMY